jgi:DNA-directed RNA polymerase specialized sigma24 family protein
MLAICYYSLMPSMNLKAIERVKELRDSKGLSFREIAKLMDSDVKTVYRWYSYTVGKGKKVIHR